MLYVRGIPPFANVGILWRTQERDPFNSNHIPVLHYLIITCSILRCGCSATNTFAEDTCVWFKDWRSENLDLWRTPPRKERGTLWSFFFFLGGGGGGWRRGMLDGLAEVRRLHRSSGIHGAFLLTDPNGDASLNKISNNLVVMLMLVPCVANEDVH